MIENGNRFKLILGIYLLCCAPIHSGIKNHFENLKSQEFGAFEIWAAYHDNVTKKADVVDGYAL